MCVFIHKPETCSGVRLCFHPRLLKTFLFFPFAIPKRAKSGAVYTTLCLVFLTMLPNSVHFLFPPTCTPILPSSLTNRARQKFILLCSGRPTSQAKRKKKVGEQEKMSKVLAVYCAERKSKAGKEAEEARGLTRIFLPNLRIDEALTLCTLVENL